jgi:RecQ family ATP-dependent DNA helicase
LNNELYISNTFSASIFMRVLTCAHITAQTTVLPTTDFRSAYMKVGQFRQDHTLSRVPIMALTATASRQVRTDIIQRLLLKKGCRQLCNSVDRTNLHITVRPIKAGGVIENMAQVVRLLAADADTDGAAGGSTIVYMPTTNGVDNVTQHLSSVLEPYGLGVCGYHGKMSPELKADAHSKFLTGQCRVIVATVAFGMGIDKADVRRIVHYGSPKCLEDYYQQIGRAGRDGRVSQCLLLHSDSDLLGYGSGFYTDSLSAEAKTRHMRAIESMRHFANCSGCRRVEILRHFEEQAPYSRCETCDNCALSTQFAEDLQRDFSSECAVLFSAIRRHMGKVIIVYCYVNLDTE